MQLTCFEKVREEHNETVSSSVKYLCLVSSHGSAFKGSDRQPQADARPNVTINAGHDHDTQHYNTMVEFLVDHAKRQEFGDFARGRARFEKEG